MAALNALDQRLEPEVGEHLADPGQTGKGMIEEHPAGLGVVRAGRVDPGGDGEAEVVDEHGSLGAEGAAVLAAGLVEPGPPRPPLTV